MNAHAAQPDASERRNAASDRTGHMPGHMPWASASRSSRGLKHGGDPSEFWWSARRRGAASMQLLRSTLAFRTRQAIATLPRTFFSLARSLEGDVDGEQRRPEAVRIERRCVVEKAPRRGSLQDAGS